MNIDFPFADLQYFTRSGADKAKADHDHLVGQQFLFEKDNEAKTTLVLVQVLPVNPPHGFGVSFLFSNHHRLSIHEFCLLNNITSYQFNNYENF